MPTWTDSLLVFLGAGIGANARFWISYFMASKGETVVFPWGTFLINVTGSLFIGLLAGLLSKHMWPGSWRVFVGVGVLGGYTTFSTFSLEALQLFEQGRGLLALLYILGSVAFGILGCWIAWSMSRG